MSSESARNGAYYEAFEDEEDSAFPNEVLVDEPSRSPGHQSTEEGELAYESILPQTNLAQSTGSKKASLDSSKGADPSEEEMEGYLGQIGTQVILDCV